MLLGAPLGKLVGSTRRYIYPARLLISVPVPGLMVAYNYSVIVNKTG